MKRCSHENIYIQLDYNTVNAQCYHYLGMGCVATVNDKKYHCCTNDKYICNREDHCQHIVKKVTFLTLLASQLEGID